MSQQSTWFTSGVPGRSVCKSARHTPRTVRNGEDISGACVCIAWDRIDMMAMDMGYIQESICHDLGLLYEGGRDDLQASGTALNERSSSLHARIGYGACEWNQKSSWEM